MMLLAAILSLVFTAKEVDIQHNRVRVESMFPVRLELEPLTPETTAKGEVLSGCKLVKVTVDSPSDNPYHLKCKDKREFRVKAITFEEAQ